jgi:predicted permease
MRPIEDLRADATYALRVLRRAPGFAAVAVLSLALGIGVNALVFSVVNTLVLRPLPVERPGQVLTVQSAGDIPSQSYPNYRDLRDRNRTLAGLAGYRISPVSVEHATTAVREWGYLATGNYFDVLGIEPVAGGFFHQADDRAPGANPYVVLGYDEWQTRFGGEPDVVGTTVRLNGSPYTILGVAPRGFRGTELFYQPAFWIPMTMQPLIEPGNAWLDRRQTSNIFMVGRLRPGVSASQAEADLNTIAAQLTREYPTINADLRFRLAQPGLFGDMLGGPVRAFAVAVLLLAALVLLTACANLAGLLAARAADRRRELAIRMAIGAGRGRVLRQMLTEAFVLAAAGGVAGAVLAVIGARALSAWHAPVDLPVQLDIVVDGRVLLFAFVATMLAAGLLGLLPALQASRSDPQRSLKGEASRRFARRRWALRDVLVLIQVALCFVLVAGCVLAVRGLQRSLTMPLGFNPDGAAIASVDLGLAGYDEARAAAFRQRAVHALSGLPGVTTAAFANSLPLSIDQSTTTVYPDTRSGNPNADRHTVLYYQVSPGFFDAIGMRLLAGRGFDSRDDRHAPGRAVVNQTFAKEILRGAPLVGSHFRYGRSEPPIDVIGIAEDARYRSLTESPEPVVFIPMLQSSNLTTVFLVRSTRPASQMSAEIRRVLTTLDPSLPVYDAETLRDMLGLALFPMRAAAAALSAFGLLAMVLAASGLHGLVSYAVARRTHEIGIRIAIGAGARQVLATVLARTAWLLGIGAVLGAGAALVAGRLLATVVYGASPQDPVVFIATAAVLLFVGFVSCWTPALRALRISPVTALRTD